MPLDKIGKIVTVARGEDPRTALINFEFKDADGTIKKTAITVPITAGLDEVREAVKNHILTVLTASHLERLKQLEGEEV
jgi:hypothetical protein